MRNSMSSGALGAVLVLTLLGLGACAKHDEPAQVAALPPPPPPPPQPPPPAPSADELLQRQLAQLGAKPGDGGWSVTLVSGHFHAGKVAFSADEQATIESISALLKGNPHLRLQIDNYLDKRGSNAHLKEVSQMQANSILRDLTASGADEDRMQAQGKVDSSQHSRVEVVFSNVDGEFRPAPVENS